MRYSLDARFRGCLLGAVVGESQANIQGKANNRSHSQLFLRVCELIVKSDGRDFEQVWKFLESENLNTTAEFILGGLPLGLFFHDNWSQLRSHLDILIERLQINQVNRDWMYVFSYLLSLFLREESKLENLPMGLLEVVEPSESVAAVLMLIADWQQQKPYLVSTNREKNLALLKPHSEIAIALYYLLSSCEDLQLSVVRATRNNDCQGVAAIVGALSGAYNSEVGIPVKWYLNIAKVAFPGVRILNSTQVLKLADELLASWSGVYAEATIQSDLGIMATVASPRVMRLR